MTLMTVIAPDGEKLELRAAAGGSLMQAIRDAGIEGLLAVCGGQRSCATCHVYCDSIEASVLPKMSEEEGELLEGSSHRRSTSRLSCQIPFDDALDGATVTIAPLD